MTGSHYIPLIIEKLKPTDPEKIILFGSYAYGEPSTGSDLDILVVTGDDVIPSSFSEKSLYLPEDFKSDCFTQKRIPHRFDCPHKSNA